MPILTQSFIGLSGGMNQAVPAFEVPDGQATILRDVLLDKPGMIRRRGPVSLFSANLNKTGFRGAGMFVMSGMDGALRAAVIGTDVSNATATLRQWSILPLDSGLANYGTVLNCLTVPATDAATAKEVIVATSQAVGYTGAGWIGVAEKFLVNGDKQMLGLWRGSRLAPYSTGTITFSAGSTTITGVATAWSGSNVDQGMFLFANTSGVIWEFVGTVASVASATSLILEKGALFRQVGSASYKLLPVKGFATRMAKGSITTVAGSPEIIGSGTAFTGLTNVGTAPGWRIYRLSDMTLVGHIASVHNDRWITIDDAGGAAITMTNERYVIIATRQDVATAGTGDLDVTQLTSQGMSKVGFLSAAYSGRQWYANSGPVAANGLSQPNRLWFSDYADPEAVDVSPTGDWLDINSQGRANGPIIALAGLQNSLAIFKEGELFQLVGNDPSNFGVRKIADVGTISPQTVQPYRNGVVFTGKEGIYFFDGVQLHSLYSDLGSWFQFNMIQYNPAAYQFGWSMLIRDHYLVYLPYFGANNTSTVLPCMRGAVVESPDLQGNGFCFCINMQTGAVTVLSNINLKGSAILPAINASSINNSLYLGNQTSGAEVNTKALTFDGAQMFDSTGVTSLDAFALCHFGANNSTKGPNVYIETKKYTMGDAERKKLFKQLAMQYLLTGQTLTVDSVPGMNAVGTTNSTTFLTSASYQHKRIKFLKRDTMIQFRIYDTTAPPGAITAFVFGPHEVGFKWQRIGRV